MNENLELLEYIYQNAEMGSASLKDLRKLLKGKENKIIKQIDKQLEGYEDFVKESKELLDCHDVKAKEIGLMSKTMAYMNMKMETMMDNSDAKIADMLIKGSTMGTVEIEKNIKKYKESASKEILDLAKKLLSFEEKNIETLKEYL